MRYTVRPAALPHSAALLLRIIRGTPMRPLMTLATLLLAAALVAADDKAKDDAKDDAQPAADAKAKDAPKPAAQGWRPLFDGKTLAGWKTAQFGAHAEPEVKDGQLVLPTGDPLTGATRAKDDVPHVNYEIELEAQRAEGSDF